MEASFPDWVIFLSEESDERCLTAGMQAGRTELMSYVSASFPSFFPGLVFSYPVLAYLQIQPSIPLHPFSVC